MKRANGIQFSPTTVTKRPRFDCRQTVSPVRENYKLPAITLKSKPTLATKFAPKKRLILPNTHQNVQTPNVKTNNKAVLERTPEQAVCRKPAWNLATMGLAPLKSTVKSKCSINDSRGVSKDPFSENKRLVKQIEPPIAITKRMPTQTVILPEIKSDKSKRNSAGHCAKAEFIGNRIETLDHSFKEQARQITNDKQSFKPMHVANIYKGSIDSKRDIPANRQVPTSLYMKPMKSDQYRQMASTHHLPVIAQTSVNKRDILDLDLDLSLNRENIKRKSICEVVFPGCKRPASRNPYVAEEPIQYQPVLEFLAAIRKYSKYDDPNEAYDKEINGGLRDNTYDGKRLEHA